MERLRWLRPREQSIRLRGKTNFLPGTLSRAGPLPLLGMFLCELAAADTGPGSTPVHDDCRTAAHYYSTAQNGNKTSQSRLQQMQAEGRCYPKDYDQARALYQKEVLSTGSSNADDDLNGYMAQVLCDASKSFIVPSADQAPAEAQDSRLSHCDASDLYYGVKGKID
jgi:hypothetical protein